MRGSSEIETAFRSCTLVLYISQVLLKRVKAAHQHNEVINTINAVRPHCLQLVGCWSLTCEVKNERKDLFIRAHESPSLLRGPEKQRRWCGDATDQQHKSQRRRITLSQCSCRAQTQLQTDLMSYCIDTFFYPTKSPLNWKAQSAFWVGEGGDSFRTAVLCQFHIIQHYTHVEQVH